MRKDMRMTDEEWAQLENPQTKISYAHKTKKLCTGLRRIGLQINHNYI